MGRESREGRRTGGEAGGGEVSVSAVGEAEGEKSRGDQVRRRCNCVLDVSVGRREEGDGETGEERHVCVRCKVGKEGGEAQEENKCVSEVGKG